MTDARFGVAVATWPPDLPAALTALGLSQGAWYSYDAVYSATAPDPQWGHAHGLPNVGRYGLVRYGMTQGQLEAAARAHAGQGGVFLMGNEPDLPGQDSISGAQYAAWLAWAAPIIRAVDSGAQFAGPGLANWDANDGRKLQSGHQWADSFLTAWGSAPLPLLAWCLHLYDWTPGSHGANPAPLLADLTACRAWLTAHGLTGAALPNGLWVTEMGVQQAASASAAIAWLDALMAFCTTQNTVTWWCPFALVATDGERGLVTPGGLPTCLGTRYAEWARGEAT